MSNIPSLSFFSIEKLLEKLNSEIEDSDEEIELGMLEEGVKNSNGANRIVEQKGRFPLTQKKYDEILGELRFDKNINLGYIEFEKGEIIDDGDGRYYEKIKLRLKRNLELKDCCELRKCSVKLYKECESFVENYLTRKDHLQFIGIMWKSDLTNDLPSEWFEK